MLGEGVEIGDKVVLNVAKENREWGYNPGNDGDILEVVGFSEIDYSHVNNFGHVPGIYQNRCWIKVKFENGKTETIGSCHLNPEDKTKYDNRIAEWRRIPDNVERFFIRSLPETKFYEEDVFTSHDLDLIYRRPFGTKYKVSRIHYEDFGKYYDNGHKKPEYDFIIPGGGTSWCHESQMVLEKRGNIWKYYHNEQVNFKDIEEEANFFDMIGHTSEIKNPLYDSYSWNVNESIAAIKLGFAHGLKDCGRMILSKGKTYYHRSYPVIFKDEELGKRVAEYTLNSFER